MGDLQVVAKVSWCQRERWYHVP